MAYPNVAVLVFMALAFLLFPAAAQADIGAIGSPVVPSNAPPPDANETDEDNASPPAPKPAAPPAAIKPQLMLVMHFDHPHPGVDHDLKEAVETMQKNKPNAFYQVVSYVPSGAATPQTQQGIDDAAANLALITQKMQDLGIQSNRIRAETEFSGLVPYQEIRIFVY